MVKMHFRPSSVTHRVSGSGKGISLSELSPFFSLPVSQWPAFTRKPTAPASSTFFHSLYYTSGLKQSFKLTEVLSSLAVASSVWYQQTPVVQRVCAGEGNVPLYRNTIRCGTKSPSWPGGKSMVVGLWLDISVVKTHSPKQGSCARGSFQSRADLCL